MNRFLHRHPIAGAVIIVAAFVIVSVGGGMLADAVAKSPSDIVLVGLVAILFGMMIIAGNRHLS